MTCFLDLSSPKFHSAPITAFTGQNQDTAAGLYDFLYREYAPTQGRWISPDFAGLGAVVPSDPQTWNRYVYVRNAPLFLTDADGLCDDDKPCHFLSEQNCSVAGGACASTMGYTQLDLQTFGIMTTGVFGFCPAMFTRCVSLLGGTVGFNMGGAGEAIASSHDGETEFFPVDLVAANNGTNKPTVQQCLNNAQKTYYAQVNAGLSALPSFHLFSIPGVGTSAIGGGITIGYELLNGASLASSLSTGGVSALIGLAADAIWNTGSYLYKSNQVFDAARANYNANIAQCK